jgi:hypothetical protein
MKLPLAGGKYWKLADRVATIFAVSALFAFFGFVYIFGQYDATRPTRPDASAGRIYAQVNHGHSVYLTEAERWRRNEFGVIAGSLASAALVVEVLLGAGIAGLHLANARKP